MIKRKEIMVYDCINGFYMLSPKYTKDFYYDDIYGDTYKNKKDYWELVEDKNEILLCGIDN